jgi:hypothetical protein
MSDRFEHVQFTTDDIGVLLLESITKGLYTDARHCIREYVQNEYDAGALTVYVDVNGRSVSVMGDSQGMTRDDLLRARRIGYSEKDPGTQAGFRGIGIWSGVAVCHTMNVITKTKGAEEGYYLRVDAKGLREAIKRREQKPLVQALTENVTMRSVRADEIQQKFGTRVELVDVLREHDRILEQPQLMSYLAQTAPVAINPFQPLAKTVLDRISVQVPGYREIVVRVNQKPVYRPPERETALQPPNFDSIKNDDGVELAFVWYAMNQRPGTLDPEERGLVYKAKGFTIGDIERSTVRKLEPGASVQLNSGWVSGEIHLLSPLLVPNSERIDLETNSTSEFLRNRVRELLRRIDKEVRHFSEKRSADSHVADAERALGDVEAAPDLQTRIEKLATLHRAGELLVSDLKSPKTSPELKPRVAHLLKEIERRKGEVFREIKIPEGEAEESKAKKRTTIAKRTQEAVDVDRHLPDMISAFKLGDAEGSLLKSAVESLRAAGVPDGKILRFLQILESKLSYRRLHGDPAASGRL